MRTWTNATLAVASLVLLAAPALAAGNSHYGIRAGVNAARFAGEFGKVFGPDNLVAPNVGLVYEYDFAPSVAFHGELAYAGKGASTEVEGTDEFGNPLGEFKAPWKFQYLEIPLFMHARLPALGKATPFLEAGPAFGITLAGKLTAAPPFPSDVDLKGAMRPIDVGVAVGGGFAFAAGPGRLGIDLRWTRGLDNPFKAASPFDVFNETWTVALSYMR